MYISLSTLVFLLLAIRFGIWLDDHSTPAYDEWKRKQRVWKAEDRQRREQNRVACRALQRRYMAVARLYFKASFVQYWEFMRWAKLCKTDAALNRYVTLAEHFWATTALAPSPEGRSSVPVPTPPGH